MNQRGERRPVRTSSQRRPTTTTRRGRQRAGGQSLVEFALVLPILTLFIGGIIQFGLIFWSQVTLTQVVRDTGRWAATQQQCSNAVPIIATANSIATNSTLFGYTNGSWTASNVSVSWQVNAGEPCPPDDNSTVAFVTVSVNHQIPLFFPWIPGSGNLSSTAQFRMEPAP